MANETGLGFRLSTGPFDLGRVRIIARGPTISWIVCSSLGSFSVKKDTRFFEKTNSHQLESKLGLFSFFLSLTGQKSNRKTIDDVQKRPLGKK